MRVVSVLTIRIENQTEQEVSDIRHFFEMVHQVLAPQFEHAIVVEPNQNPFDLYSWQIVFDHSVSAFLYYRWLIFLLHPLALRGGLGVAIADEDYHFYQKAATYSQEALKQGEAFEVPVLLYHANFVEDCIVNALLLQWKAVHANRQPMQQVIQYLYEFLAPLYVKGRMLTHKWDNEKIQTIVQLKSAQLNDPETYPNLSVQQPLSLKPSRWVAVEEGINKHNIYITGLYQKSHSTAIAEMIQMKRQNIDYHLKKAQMAQERHLVAAILMQFDREWQSF